MRIFFTTLLIICISSCQFAPMVGIQIIQDAKKREKEQDMKNKNPDDKSQTSSVAD